MIEFQRPCIGPDTVSGIHAGEMAVPLYKEYSV